MKRVLAVAVLAFLGVHRAPDVPQFTDWGPAENLGPLINTQATDSCVAISKNGLSLFFSSTRGKTDSQDRDLYVSQRASKDEPWGQPQPLWMLNTTVWDSCPALSLDEHHLYFTSRRPGGCGGRDMWVSRRHDRRDDFGWEAPTHLGCDTNGYVNSAREDMFPTFFEDETGKVLMYFGSNRNAPSATSPDLDLFQSEMNGDGTFGPATPIAELNSNAMEHSVTVRRDGLEVIFGSTRLDGGTVLRFFTATRASTSDPWSTPVLTPGLPPNPNGRFAMSFDGTELYFASTNQPSYGGTDLWVARRQRLR